MNLKQLIFGTREPETANNKAADIGSTEAFLPIADIKNGVVITRDGQYVKILEVLPVNFYLKSPIEQQNIILSFSSYLKVAPDILQIRVVTRKADIGEYTTRMRLYMEREENQNCRDMIEDNIQEVEWLARSMAVTRRFFLVFQYENRAKADTAGFNAIVQKLNEDAETACRYLELCGLEVRSHNNDSSFPADTLYTIVNKRTSSNGSVQFMRDAEL